MKRLFIIGLVLVTCGKTAFAQNSGNTKPQREISVGLGSFYSKPIAQNVFGMNLDLVYYWRERWSTGFQCSASQRKIGASFAYTDPQPVLTYDELGWLNQYDVLHSDRVRISADLNTGLGISRLGDNSVKERYWTKYGYEYRPKEVATDKFGIIEPGASFSYRVLEHDHDPDVYLTVNARYRFAYGNFIYSNHHEFDGAYFGLSICMTGLCD